VLLEPFNNLIASVRLPAPFTFGNAFAVVGFFVVALVCFFACARGLAFAFGLVCDLAFALGVALALPTRVFLVAVLFTGFFTAMISLSFWFYCQRY